MRISLRGRIAATVAVAVLGSTVAVTYAAYELERRSTENRFVAAAREGAVADLQQAANAIDRRSGETAARAVAGFVSQRGGISWVVLDPATGESNSSMGPRANGLPEDSLISLATLDTTWTDLGQGRLLALGGQVGNSGTYLVEFYNFGPVQQQLSRLRSDLIRVDIVGLAVALILGIAVASRISRPVRLAAASAQQFGSGALDTRMPVHGNDELSDLARSFNEMAQRLSDAQQQQRRFVSDVSHELRTPLAAMLAAAEGLESTQPELRDRSAALVGEQARRMRSLVEDLLEISRFDAGQAGLELETVEIDALARDAARTVAPDDDVQIVTLGDPRLDADARRLHTVLRNLIGNAVQHGTPPVVVTVDGRGPWLGVTVADAGPGVEAALVPVIFDRFTRGRRGRTTRSGSTGLGLAIARENAQLHGGSLTVDPHAPSTFLLLLPRDLMRQ